MGFFSKLGYYISRQKGTASSPTAIVFLYSVVKSDLKKKLTSDAYKSISKFEITHEMANRYICQFYVKGTPIQFYVIADNYGSVVYQGLDVQAIERLV